MPGTYYLAVPILRILGITLHKRDQIYAFLKVTVSQMETENQQMNGSSLQMGKKRKKASNRGDSVSDLESDLACSLRSPCVHEELRFYCEVLGKSLEGFLAEE